MVYTDIKECPSSLQTMKSLVSRFLHDDKAATAIEYGLIAALIALVVITALNNIGTRLSAKFTTIATSLR